MIARRTAEVIEIRAGLDYVLGKMVGLDEVFDGEATSKAIREDILRARRAKECSAEEARAEWPPKEFDSECEFWEWCGDTELFKNSEAHLYYETCDGRRAHSFARLYEVFWPILAAELSKAA